MSVSRRNFLKTSAFAVAALCSAGLAGCKEAEQPNLPNKLTNSSDSSGTAQVDGPLSTEYLFRDGALRGKSASTSKALAFDMGGTTLYGKILVPSDYYEKARPVVVMFHGLAGFTSFDDVCMALCRAGCIAVIPSHQGAWGSDGRYLVTNCINDAQALTDMVRGEEFATMFNADSDKVFLMGHGVGGNTVINTAGRATGVRGAILLAPCDIATLAETQSEAEVIAFLEENDVDVLNSRGVEAIYSDIVDNADWMKFTVAAEAAKDPDFFIASGSMDAVCPAKSHVEPVWKVLQQNQGSRVMAKKSYSADHSLMSSRIELTGDIAAFINESCTK